MDLMHDATLEGVDPAKPFVSSLTELDKKILDKGPRAAGFDEVTEKVADDVTRKKAHARLTARFDALPREARKIFNEVRDTEADRASPFDRLRHAPNLFPARTLDADFDGIDRLEAPPRCQS